MVTITEELSALLDNSPLFSGVSPELLGRYLQDSEVLELTAGEILLAPGDYNEKIYVLLNGRVRISPEGAIDDILAMFGEGETVGEMSILDDSKANTYLIADTPCQLLAVDHTTVWAMINDSHQIARNMLNVLAMRVPITDPNNQANVEGQQGYIGFRHVDELTGLYNSEWMRQMFGRQVQRCAQGHDTGTLLMLCIDEFKHYNQVHGRLGGDQALRSIAQTILSCLRPNDQAARYQGNTFAVFLPHTSLNAGKIAAERLRRQASETLIVTPSGDALPNVTVSIGLKEVGIGSSLDDLLEQANNSLEFAHQSGANCISF